MNMIGFSSTWSYVALHWWLPLSPKPTWVMWYKSSNFINVLGSSLKSADKSVSGTTKLAFSLRHGGKSSSSRRSLTVQAEYRYCFSCSYVLYSYATYTLMIYHTSFCLIVTLTCLSGRWYFHLNKLMWAIIKPNQLKRTFLVLQLFSLVWPLFCKTINPIDSWVTEANLALSIK